MEGTSHVIHRKTLERDHGKNIRHNFINVINEAAAGGTFTLAIVGLLIGRVSIINDLSPFGTAFLVASSLTADIKNTAVVGISIILGILTKGNTNQTIQAIITIMLVFAAIKTLKFNSRTAVLKAGAVVFAINFIIALIFNLIINGQFILYNTLLGLFGSTISMALVYIFHYSIPIIIEHKKRKLLSNEEVICTAVACAVIISGLADIYILGASIRIILSIIIIIYISFGRGPGVGAAMGTALGLITFISSGQMPLAVGTYAFCGLLSGIFKDLGKLCTGLGFAIGDAVILLYIGGEGGIIGLKELAAGILLFYMLPASIIDKAFPFIRSGLRAQDEKISYAARVKDMLLARIANMTDVFKELSKTLQESEDGEKLRQSSEINSIINSVADKVCTDCEARNICWKRDFYHTYQNMFDMIDTIEADGNIEMDTAPEDLKKKCLKINQLMKVSSYMYDIYRMNYKWRRKAQESKRVVCEQLDGINGILREFSKSIKGQAQFNEDIEEELAVALDKEGIDFYDVAVLKDKTGRTEVDIYRMACLGKRKCIKDITPVVSKVLNKNMKRDKVPCMIKEDTNLCYFKLVEGVKYQILTGIAKEAKDAQGVSGDNYSFMEINDGKYMIALSDGMGTGPSAAAESNSAITLLEKYLEAGFDRTTALKAINSVMTLKSPDDNFATIDLAVADLYTGEVELVKIGAASTYIKRVNGSVEVINSTTLPIGILNNVDIELKSAKMEHGDMLIMITDGVQETGPRDKGDWVLHVLEKIENKNPKQVAEELISEAKKRNKGEITDDMTVLVSKVWEVV